MVMLAEKGVFLDVAQRIVHPTHVPLVAKSKAVFVKGGDVGPHG